MTWPLFFKRLIWNTALTLALAVGIMGGLGYLLAGTQGLTNGAGWGLILGLVSVPFSAFVISARFWGDFAGRFSQQWIKKETEGAHPSKTDAGESGRWNL